MVRHLSKAEGPMAKDHHHMPAPFRTPAPDILKRALAVLDEGIAVFDEAGRMLDCTRTYVRLLGGLASIQPGITHFAMIEAVLRADLLEIDPMEQDDWRRAVFARWQSADPDEVVLRFRDGRTVRSVLRRDPEGGLISVLSDITRTARNEADLKQAQTRAEAATAAKSAFLANMSHEIRTPMNGVVGMADVLLDTDLSEDQRLFASTIKTSGEALLAIINDVLDFSKIEANRMELRAAPFDLEQTLHDLMLLMQPAAQAKGLDLLVDYDMFLPANLIGDQGRIRQIVTNLLGNAVKFTEDGHVLVRVVGLVEEAATTTLHITIEDTGMGVPEHAREHIFGSFNQIEDADRTRIEGTGLGLSITRRLVNMMEGEIWVDSTPGEGACFGIKLTLPIADGEPDELPCQLPRLRTALIVGASEAGRQILEKQLLAMGVTATAVPASQAAQHLELRPCDVAIVCHGTSGLDGLALAKTLSTSHPDCPILLVSSVFRDLGRAADISGVRCVLQNPAPRRALFDALRSLDQSQPPAKPAGSEPPADRQVLRRMRVLAVDDNATNRLVFQSCTRDLDLDLRLARNGAEALEAVQSFDPDIVFMDLEMPKMDGRTATAALRAQGGPRLPILAMTAHVPGEDQVGLAALDMDGAVHKPMRKSDILAALVAYAPAACAGLDATASRTKAGLPGAESAASKA
ncbi:ATP-binding protein [Pseudaestuariivita sp.]|uniref:ATP-binding protein n=1 Tax=Pseudaestuariivita sp. TaxID=2211669 RepID=UPI00405878E6